MHNDVMFEETDIGKPITIHTNSTKTIGVLESVNRYVATVRVQGPNTVTIRLTAVTVVERYYR